MADITKTYLDYAGLQKYDELIKNYINTEDAKSIKTVLWDATNEEIKFFKKENATLEDTADYKVSVASSDVQNLKNRIGSTVDLNEYESASDLTSIVNILTAANTQKGSIANLIKVLDDAINGVDGTLTAEIANRQAAEGVLKDLTTTNKGNLVAAINEVDAAVKAAGTDKADKVASALSGNFAGLDANGNLTDSGKKADDFDVAGAAAAVSGYTDGETAKTVKEVASEVAALGTAAKADVATVAIESETEAADALPTVAQVEAYVQAKTAALAGAVHFRGIVTSLDDITDPKSGDMAIVGVKEYIYNGSVWQELGDEGAYVVKEDGKSLIADTEIARLASMATIKGVDADDFIINAASGELEVASGKQITTTAQVTKLDAIAVDVDFVTDGTNKLSFASIPLVGDNSIAKLFE